MASWTAALALFAVPSDAALGMPAGLGALLLVALSLSDRRAAAVLAGRLPLWLGRISYSLYLVHLPILLATVHLLRGRLPLLVELALAVTVSLAAAEILHRAVERPSMWLGRRLASLIQPIAADRPVIATV